MEDKKIALNFLPLTNQDFVFTVYRRLYSKNETKINYPDCKRYRLPVSDNNNYEDYWVSLVPKDKFENFNCRHYFNINLTKYYLHTLITNKAKETIPSDSYFTIDKHFKKQIVFILEKFSEGKQTVCLEPYYLGSEKLFGFLIDFKFYSEVEIKKATINIQKLSLSLDKEGRENKNFYTDRYDKILLFLKKYYENIKVIRDDIIIDRELFELTAKSLSPKIYIFGDNKTGASQFGGVKEHKPILIIQNPVKIFFIFRERDRSLSRELFKGLRGETFPENFPGMTKMFLSPFDANNVSGIAIDSFEQNSFEKVINIIKSDEKNQPCILIVISPLNKIEHSDDKTYYQIKHILLLNNITSQFVSLKILNHKNQLKWAISNIGLQLFSKMGGIPWKVQPKTPKCLIIGISQAHDKQGNNVKKYFAYSILTESTGIYKELKVLGDSKEQNDYISSFKRNMKLIFEEYYNEYDNFIVHATFKIEQDELDAIKDVMDELKTKFDATKKVFVVIKFNDKNKFFGYSMKNNSMIPYESSYIRLSQKEYLVWFQGLQYHNPNVRRRVERPVHIEFIYPDELADEQKQDYLQDAINLSGANWRGFNAKSLPVSIQYAYLVAEYYKEFQSLDLEDVDIQAIKLWFL